MPKELKKLQKPILVCAAFLAVFLLVSLLRSSFHSIDAAVNQWFPSIQSNILTLFSQGIALVFDTTSLVFISIAISGALFLKHYKPQGLLLLGALGGDALLVEVIKNIDQVARPPNGLVPSGGFSFPSGHSAGVVVFGGILAYFAFRYWQSTRSRVFVGAGLGVVVAVVGFDRLYLNVHWLSDVFGGWLFGAFWLSFAVLVFGWLEGSGKFGSGRFGVVADWLYVAAVVVAVLVVVFGLIA
jgi:undecaprenyl-diphosphatase